MTSRIDLFEYFKDMCRHDIIFSYQGTLTQEVLVILGDLLRDKLSDYEDRHVLIKKVFSIFIEVAQNILHHAADSTVLTRDRFGGTGIVILRRIPPGYEIVSGNLIANVHAPAIEESCKLINSLDQEGLKQAYKQQINMPMEQNRKGAGLGLLEIARKSEKNIEFRIERMNDEVSFFMLTAKIFKSKE